jgi:hypothetical protein
MYARAALAAMAVWAAAAGRADEEKPAGWLGVAIGPVPPELAAHLGLADGAGVAVSRVLDGGPAEKAGLQENDIVVDLGDGQAVMGPEDLVDKVTARAPGETIELSVIRKGERQKVPVELGQRPAAPEASGPMRLGPWPSDDDEDAIPGLPGGGRGWYRMFRMGPGGPVPFPAEGRTSVYISSTRDGKTIEISGRDGAYTVTRRETSDDGRNAKVVTKEYRDLESLKENDDEAAELLGKANASIRPELPEEWQRLRDYIRGQGEAFEDDEFMRSLREMEEMIRERLQDHEDAPAPRRPARRVPGNVM